MMQPCFPAAVSRLDAQVTGFANQTGGNSVDWQQGDTIARLPAPLETGPQMGRVVFAALGKSIDGAVGVVAVALWSELPLRFTSTNVVVCVLCGCARCPGSLCMLSRLAQTMYRTFR